MSATDKQQITTALTDPTRLGMKDKSKFLITIARATVMTTNFQQALYKYGKHKTNLPLCQHGEKKKPLKTMPTQ